MVREFADVSEYQTSFVAHRYAAGGYPLIALKATEGIDWVDPKYAERAARAHESRIPVWHYHFAHPDSDPGAHGEASHFWRTVRPHYQPGDRLVLDVELHHSQGSSGLVDYTHNLDTRLHAISGIAAVLYTYDALLRETGPRWQVISSDWWIANYGGRVARLGAGRRMIAQQYTDGEIGGYPQRFLGIGRCDGSRLQVWYARKLRRERARALKAR